MRLERARRFFDRYGFRAIILARFVPVIRTFVPFAVGLSRYGHGRFVAANLAGAMIWGAFMPLMGFLLGGVPLIADNVGIVCLLIVLVSVLPIAIRYVGMYVAGHSRNTR